MPDKSHLLPKVELLLELSNKERIEQVKKTRWIGYPRGQDIMKKLEDLLIHPKQPRMPGMLIVGPSNNGKTSLIRKFARKHLPDNNIGGEHIIAPVLYVQAPPTPNEGAFYSNILNSLFERVPATSIDAKREKVKLVLKNIETRVLIIDELHNILAGASVKQQQFLNMIKYLSNELEVCIVGCGTGDLLRAVSIDPQVQNRFIPELLSTWPMDKAYRQLLMSFERILPLKIPSELHDKVLASQIHAISEGTIGELSTLLNMAAEYAITSGHEKIDQGILKKCGYTSPMDRNKIAARI
jgi:DNA polymerase III delta prime subunit